jgi:hypothetical protein
LHFTCLGYVAGNALKITALSLDILFNFFELLVMPGKTDNLGPLPGKSTDYGPAQSSTRPGDQGSPFLKLHFFPPDRRGRMIIRPYSLPASFILDQTG